MLLRVPRQSPEGESLRIVGARFSTARMPLLSPNRQRQSTE